MADYTYKITNKTTWQTGEVSAVSVEDAVEQIKKEGWFVAELRPVRKSFLTERLSGKKSNLSSFERINFTDHLASLIAAGTPIREALETYTEGKGGYADMVNSITKDIERGKKLSEALAKYPKTFSAFYISLVQAGEITGSLDESLEYLANELRREHEFVQRVKSAMFYPSLVLAVSLVVVVFIVTVVIPKISQVINSLGSDLPLATRIIVVSADFIVNNRALLLVLLGVLVMAFLAVVKNEKAKDKFNKTLLRLPLVGGIIKKYTLARLLRIIGSSIRYGIPLPKAFSAAYDVVGNPKYKAACERISDKITKGQSLSDSIAREDKELFPGIIVRTIKGGEKTGGVDQALLRLATSYEVGVDRDLKRLTDMIEPVLVVFLGAIVALIAISVIAPIYQVTSKIK
jgi:type IV pilus assembly protein PilC